MFFTCRKMSPVAWSGQLLLQKNHHHSRSTVTCPRFSRFFFQKTITKNTHSHTQHTHSLMRALAHSSGHTHTVTMHTHPHSLTPAHTHTHKHTLPGETRCFFGRAVSPWLAFQCSAKKMVRLPKRRSSRILPPFRASGLVFSEDQSQRSEKEVLLQGLSSDEPGVGLRALQGWLSAPPPPSPCPRH